MIDIYLQSGGNIEFGAYSSDVGGLWCTTAADGHIHSADMIDGLYLYTLGYIVQMFVLDLALLDALDGRRKLVAKDIVAGGRICLRIKSCKAHASSAEIGFWVCGRMRSDSCFVTCSRCIWFPV